MYMTQENLPPSTWRKILSAIVSVIEIIISYIPSKILRRK